MDLSLLITLLVIFAATLIASALSSLKRDRCLVDFDDYWAVVERLRGRPVYGRISLASTGFELLYEAECLDEQLHMEGSYVFYNAEYASIAGVYRYVDDLTADKRDERSRSWRRAFQGSFWVRLKRKVSNFVGTATDSMTNALNLVVGQTTAKAQQEKLLLAQGETEIKGLTKQMLGYVGNKFDPLLEKLVGQLVVLQITRNDLTSEYVGVLKDYSTDFVELLDCYIPEYVSVRVDRDGRVRRVASGATPLVIGAGDSWLRGMVMYLEQDHLVLRNDSDRPAVLDSLTVDKQERDVVAMLDAGQTVELLVPADAESVVVALHVMLRYDMIIPRRMALVRHRAGRFTSAHVHGQPIVGLSPVFSAEKEEHLRQKLAATPDDAQLALMLALMLIARKEPYETERWLELALERRQQLVDGGLYARLLLEYVRSEVGRVALFTELSCPS